MEIGSREWRAVIRRGAAAFDIRVGDEELELFAVYARELLRWNRTSNLTAITDPFEIAVKHFLDSIVAVRLIPARSTLLDVGTGGGFPGIPLKILQPALRLTLIDASRKKIHFIKHLSRRLGLSDTRALHCRLDEKADKGVKAAKPRRRSSSVTALLDQDGITGYDTVISRATFSLQAFVCNMIPWVKPAGRLIALQGPVSDRQFDTLCRKIKACGKDRCGVETDRLAFSIDRFRLPYLDAQRSIIRISREDADA